MIKCKLGDVSTIITGPFGSQLHASDYIKFGIPSIMPQDIEDRKVNTQKIAYVSEKDANRLKRYKVQLGDILYSRRGDIEKCALIRKENVGSLCGTGCLRVRPYADKIDSTFLSFYLNSPHIRKWVVLNATGITMPNLNSDILRQLPLEIPHIKNQKKIAYILGNLDNKINNNEQIIAALEQLAKTIYDYYFLQFDFPDSQGRPYRASGGKMVYNKELDREIPAGWSVEPLPEITDMLYGYPLSTDCFSDKGSLPVIRIRDIMENTISALSSEKIDSKYLTKAEDLLIGMDGNFHINFWPNDGDCINQRIVRLRKKKLSLMIVYFEIAPYIKALELNAGGSTVGHLSDKDLRGINVVVPDNMKFSDKCDTILKTICSLRRENKRLKSLRDFLLPLLMNGQVQFKE